MRRHDDDENRVRSRYEERAVVWSDRSYQALAEMDLARTPAHQVINPSDYHQMAHTATFNYLSTLAVKSDIVRETWNEKVAAITIPFPLEQTVDGFEADIYGEVDAGEAAVWEALSKKEFHLSLNDVYENWRYPGTAYAQVQDPRAPGNVGEPLETYAWDLVLSPEAISKLLSQADTILEELGWTPQQVKEKDEEATPY